MPAPMAPADVTRALTTMVANNGDAARTARELKDADPPLEIAESTLKVWRSERYVEQYRQLEVRYSEGLEAEAIGLARQNLKRAGEIEKELLEKQLDARDPAQALRAVADSGKKNADKVLALTGRTPTEAGGEDLMGLLKSMAARGYLRINIGPELLDHEGDAEGITEAETEPPAA